MSATDLSTPTATPPSPTGPRGGSAVWARVALACAILLGSAGFRFWQSRRIEGALEAGRRGPRIDLAELPMTLGPWKGLSTELDPQIARGTGADQVVTRRYVNQDTGVAVEMILLYGPAVEMYIHSPEVCYPAAGYALRGGPDARPVEAGDVKAPFRSLVYSKGEGAVAERQEVYFSWWYNGRWTPDVGNQKHFERIPSMYKVQLARRVTEQEKRDVGNPCEAFLKELLPEMARRIASTTGQNGS
jgi:EpsI family protein